MSRGTKIQSRAKMFNSFVNCHLRNYRWNGTELIRMLVDSRPVVVCFAYRRRVGTGLRGSRRGDAATCSDNAVSDRRGNCFVKYY